MHKISTRSDDVRVPMEIISHCILALNTNSVQVLLLKVRPQF